MTTTITRATARDTFARMIDTRNASGTLRGRWHIARDDGPAAYWVQNHGRMTITRSGAAPRLSDRFTADHYDRLETNLQHHGALYVVYSYCTPIGWTDGTGWCVPPVTYSPTTTRHQGLLPADGAAADPAHALAAVAAMPDYRRRALETARRAARSLSGVAA